MRTIFKAPDLLKWEHYLEEKNLKLDIYYHLDFLNIDAHINNGEAFIFLYEEFDKIFIYPFIRTPVNLSSFEGYFDIQSPYGYCGPYVNNEDTLFFERAEKSLVDYFKGEKIVSEFVRYHYLYNAKILFQNNIKNFKNRTIVVLDLTLGKENIWKKEFSTKCRNLHNKMAKEDFAFEFSNDESSIVDFYNLYTKTMENVNADRYYYFSLEFLNKLSSELNSQIKLCKITKDSITYASALFYIKNGIVTYYLSARNLHFPKVNSNSYLLSSLALWAGEKGYEYLNLGGGTSDDLENSLFSFKKNFSSKTLDFYIGKRIHLEDIYQKLINSYIEQHGAEAYDKRKQLLQFYKY